MTRLRAFLAWAWVPRPKLIAAEVLFLGVVLFAACVYWSPVSVFSGDRVFDAIAVTVAAALGFKVAMLLVVIDRRGG